MKNGCKRIFHHFEQLLDVWSESCYALHFYNVCLVVHAPVEESLALTEDSFQGAIKMYLKYFNYDSHSLWNEGKFSSLI